MKKVQLSFEMDERKTVQDIFIDTLSFFNQKNSQERKKISYGDLLWGMFTSFLHLEVTRNTSANFSN